jgi:hypothetical protein
MTEPRLHFEMKNFADRSVPIGLLSCARVFEPHGGIGANGVCPLQENLHVG